MTIFKKTASLKKYAAALALLVVVIFTGCMIMLPQGVHADSSQLSTYLQLKNPLGNSTTDVPGFFQNILQGLVLLLTPVLVIMVIYSAFLFVSAQGNAEKLDEAKKAMLWTLVGAAIVLGAQGIATIMAHTANSLIN